MLHIRSWGPPPPPSLINLKDDELDHTAAVWCMVKDRCDHDKGFLEAWNLNRYKLTRSVSTFSSPRSSQTDPLDLDEEMVEDSSSDKDADTDVEELVDLPIHPEDQEDDIITSSQRPVVKFYQGSKPPRFGGMLKLKKTFVNFRTGKSELLSRKIQLL